MFNIVLFIKGNVVEIVPQSWMKSSDLCYWPPPGLRASKMVQKACPVNQAWNVHEVKILESAEFYDEALVKVRKAIDGSDVTSTTYEEVFRNTVSRAGRIYKPKRYSSSESEDSVLEDYGHPPQKRIKNDSPTPVENHMFVNKEEVSDTEVHTNENDFPSETVLNPNASRSDKLAEQFISLQRQIVTLLEQVNENQKRMSNDIQQLVTSLFPQPSLETDKNLPDLPFESDMELEEFDKQLKDPDKSQQLVNCLRRIGGSSFEDQTRRVLTHLMVNGVAVKYSYTGRKGKKSFENLNLKKVIFAVLQSANPYVTDHLLQKTISDWLRYAKTRKENRTSRNFPTII